MQEYVIVWGGWGIGGGGGTSPGVGITSEEGVGGHRCMQDDIGEEGSLVQGIKRSYRGSLGLLFHAGVVIARGSRGVIGVTGGYCSMPEW